MTRVFSWLSALITALGVVSLCVAVWVGLPISGIAWLEPEPVRGGIIAVILALLLLSSLLRWRARKRATAELEGSLLTTQAGDGPLLAERMRAALTRLRTSGGASALYDLPWYILIGPPGAGKTTALVHSGLEFPGEHAAPVSGFGGTKNCDFWFAQDAVMIDTAGRYTTQDSDATADRNSWSSFLGQLKTARPDQPINGVILAFSCSDMMTQSAQELEQHAQTVRARLAELNEAFNTYVPVYVIFTKADMIAGFREYFGSFDEARRKMVWGTTFQTRNRKEETYRAVPREFGQLVARLSDEVTDRLMEETDSATRIAIFGFPEQMALLERNVTAFLTGIFEKPQQIRAILRGFYFTSGTQGGTPIDQVLGVMGGKDSASKAGFLSGKGRSYFLHDLLKRVIFEERDWVGYDRGRVVRRAIARAVAKSVISTVTVATMAVLGYSFWVNATLVREVAGQTALYEEQATGLLGSQRVTSAATRPVLRPLQTLRSMPTGYANPWPQSFVEQLGLSRRDSLSVATVQAYSDSLEQLLRPRMMLQVENDLAQFLEEGRKVDAYRALKVYILLAKEQDGREDDLAIQTYFAQAWADEYSGADAEYRAINAHLAAMLELDSRATPLVSANAALIQRVREEVADVPPARRAYNAIRSEAGTLPPLRLGDLLGEVPGLGTTDGRALATLEVPGLYSFDGYWGFFQDAVAGSAAQLERDAWVLGGFDTQPLLSDEQLAAEVQAIYARDFERLWSVVLDRIVLIDPLAHMELLSDPEASPLLRLADVVRAETRLTNVSDKALKNNEKISYSPANLALAASVERPFALWQEVLEGDGFQRPLYLAIVNIGAARDVAATGQGDLFGLLPVEGPYPETILRLLGQIRAALSPSYVDAQLVALDQGRCVAGAPPVGAAFGAVFGYGGLMESIQQSAPGAMSDRAQRRFAAAAAVRRAFFTEGLPDAAVPFTVRVMLVRPEVAAATFAIADQTAELIPGGDAAPMAWVEGADITLGIPDQPPLTFGDGDWAILDFLSGPTLQSRAQFAQVTYNIGPYAATFRLEFEGRSVPFLGAAMSEILCSNALE